jgi:hypothetical protein
MVWELINGDAKQTGAKVTARAGPLVSHQLALFAGGFVLRVAHRGNWLNPIQA